MPVKGIISSCPWLEHDLPYLELGAQWRPFPDPFFLPGKHVKARGRGECFHAAYLSRITSSAEKAPSSVLRHFGALSIIHSTDFIKVASPLERREREAAVGGVTKVGGLASFPPRHD